MDSGLKIPLWTAAGLKIRLTGPELEPEGKLVSLPQPFARLGRYPAMDIRLDSPQVARWHLYLHRFEQGIFFLDLGTRRGIRFGNRTLRHGWVVSGKAFQVGPFQLCVDVQAASGNFNPLEQLTEEEDKLLPVWLSLVDSIGLESQYRLKRTLTIIGRAGTSPIRLMDREITASHLLFYRTRDSCWVVNLAGVGFYRAGCPVNVEVVTDGQEYDLGNHRLHIAIGHEPVARRPFRQVLVQHDLNFVPEEGSNGVIGTDNAGRRPALVANGTSVTRIPGQVTAKETNGKSPTTSATSDKRGLQHETPGVDFAGQVFLRSYQLARRPSWPLWVAALLLIVAMALAISWLGQLRSRATFEKATPNNTALRLDLPSDLKRSEMDQPEGSLTTNSR